MFYNRGKETLEGVYAIMGLKRLKKLKTVVKKRSVKNWKWEIDISPDGRYKARFRKVIKHT